MPAYISGSLRRKCSSASKFLVLMTVPLGKTIVSESRVEYELNSVPHAIPLELFATTPPIVQAISLAGSGPSLRPYLANAIFTCFTVAPGCTRTRAPLSNTSISLK